MSSRALALIAVASMAPASAALGALTPDHRVRPGVGAGGVRLGMTEGQVLRVLGKPDSRETATTELGTFIELTWPGIQVRRWDGGGGRVVDVAVTDRGIRMDNGIGVGSSRTRVRAAFPKAECDSPRICRIGDAVPGNTVTTIRFTAAGRVSELSVGRVID